MDVLELPGWRILYDPEATRMAYGQVRAGGAESCDCTPCRNWVQTRDTLMPPDLVKLFDRLGISPNRDAEVYHCGRVAPGKHLYSGWYHFIGQVEFGEREESPFAVFGSFRVFFHSSPVLLPEAFAGLSVVQVEFEAELPWLSGLPEAK